MLAGLASLVFIPLLSIAFIHMVWAFGFTFPAKTETDLARTVVGLNGITKMPPRWASFGVAVIVFIAGIWALSLSGTIPNTTLILGGIAATIIFTLRGVIGFSPQWREKMGEEPFATFDRKLYSPLCLGLGFGFGLLTFLNATPVAG